MKDVRISTYGKQNYFFFYDLLTALAMNELLRSLNDKMLIEEYKKQAFAKKEIDSTLFQKLRKDLNFDFDELDHDEIIPLRDAMKKSSKIKKYQKKYIMD